MAVHGKVAPVLFLKKVPYCEFEQQLIMGSDIPYTGTFKHAKTN